MDIQLQPTRLSGTVTPPASKSMTHRAVLALLLSEGTGSITNASVSQDITATKQCAAALRAQAEPGVLPRLDCGESGSTLRFLIPVVLALWNGGIFTGHGRLMQRPQQPYFDIFREQGISWTQTADALTVQGTLHPGTFRLPGNVSSQFVTGLLYALPLLDGESVIEVTSPLESRSYVDMTLEMLHRFGIQVFVEADGQRFRVPGKQIYHAQTVTIESDWSQAAFWYAALALGSTLDLQGLSLTSAQGDAVVRTHFTRLNRPGDVTIDVSDCPDLLPPLAVMAAVRQGTTFFVNAARLRLKESDRLTTTAAMLRALGGAAQELPDGLTVQGLSALRGGTVDGANDHRIVMAAAIAATACHEPVTILGAQAVEKSYPTFWSEYERLGGAVHVL